MPTSSQVSFRSGNEKKSWLRALLCVTRHLFSGLWSRREAVTVKTPICLEERASAHDIIPAPLLGSGETIEEARIAIARVLERNVLLKDLVENTETTSLAGEKHAIKSCAACAKGRVHFVGRNKLPNGRLGMGGLFVCDQCGNYNSSSLS